MKKLTSRITSVLGSARSEAGASSSPAAAGALYLKLSPAEVDLFPGNPRLLENQNYAQLRESILQRGLEITPTVALDPKTGRYTIYKGGNTRLKIMKELVEAGHPEFAQIEFRVVEWVSLVDAQVAHLIENGVRDDLTFIERSRLVLDAKAELDDEQGKLTDDAFIAEMTKFGYPSLNKKLLALMRWATGTGWKLFPKQLTSGLGINRCENLRSAVSAIEQQAKASGFDQAETGRAIEAAGKKTDANKDEFSIPAFQAEAAKKLRLKTKPLQSKKQKPGKGRAGNNESSQISAPEAVLSIPQCRERAGDLAAKLAQKHHLAGCIDQVDNGLGFVITDAPVLEMDNPIEKRKCAWVFWQLLDYSDLLSVPRKLLPEKILKNCRAELSSLFTKDYEPAFSLLGVPELGADANRVVRLLDSDSFSRFLELQQLYRRLHQLSVDQKTNLWT